MYIIGWKEKLDPVYPSFCEGTLIVNEPTCNDLLKVDTAEVMKVAFVWLSK